jgi:hypothetical protein
VLWWGVRSPFVVGRQPLQGKGVYDKLVWFLLFVVATGITLTQGAKVVLAYLVSRRMTKRDWICLASGAAAAVLAAVGFYVVKLMLLGSGGRTVSSAFADLFSCIPHDLTIVQRLRMLEMFFFEPIVPHGVPYSVSEIVVAYSSWWQYALCAAIYLATAVGAYRMRSTLLVKMIVVMFCVDAVIHLVMFWGMSEAQIYCGHWFYVLPILIAGAWKKGVIKKPSDML